jgi:GT2 family glycosyltransferase
MSRTRGTAEKPTAGRLVTDRYVKRAKQLAHRALRTAHTVRSMTLLQGLDLFDQDWYQRQAGREWSRRAGAVRHYLTEGRSADLSPHPLYEPRAHIREEVRRRRGRVAPFVLFLRQCRTPRTRPHYLFDPATYLREHPEAAEHRYGAWGHFLDHAGDDTVLPLPPDVPALPIPRRPFIEGQRRHAARWAAQEQLVREPRLTPRHDARAQQRLLVEIADRPLPTADGPLVSVLTTVRNRPNLVLEAIASVMAQSLQDWEMIVVDDGSDDTTPDAVAEVARHDPRVRLLRRSHAGVSAARNAAISESRGRYVAWLDSDNTWNPRFLEVMVRALHTRALRAAYSACEFVTGKDVLYREFAGGLEHLGVGNFIDLNVLVVERELLDETGGFDEGLPRAVDYDLVFRLARRTGIGYVPFLGTVYADDNSDPNRISVKEFKSWNYVVRDRYTVDWDTVRRTLRRRVGDRVSVVVTSRELWVETWRTVRSVLRHTPPGVDLEVVVVDLGSRRAAYLLTAALEAADPRVRVLRAPVNVNRPTGANLGLAATTAGTVVFLAPGAEVCAGWLEPLRETLADPTAVAAAGVTVSRRGLVASAGLILPDGGVLPVHLLRDHGENDAARLPDRLEVPAAAGWMLAARAADLVEAGGFDALYVDAFEDADLCLRLRERTGRRCVVATGARAVVPDWLPFNGGDADPDNVRLFTSRWSASTDDRPDLWAAAGFELTGYKADAVLQPRRSRGEEPKEVSITRPVLELLPATTTDALPPPRWGVELPDGDDGSPGVVVGRGLARELTALGFTVDVRPASLRDRCPTYLDRTVVVVDDGAGRATPPPGDAVAALVRVMPGGGTVAVTDTVEGFTLTMSTTAGAEQAAAARLLTEVLRPPM